MASSASSSLVSKSIAAHTYTILPFTFSSVSSTATSLLYLGGTYPGIDMTALAQSGTDACETPSSSAISQDESPAM
ncbi:MAG: hypothetical protein RAK18_05205 [Conexivisphaerales archaeon]|nr:hypothetical protein [Conexivisphaerales archaeon]